MEVLGHVTEHLFLGFDAISVHEGSRRGEVETTVATLVIMKERVEIKVIQHITGGQRIGEIQSSEVALQKLMGQ